MKKKIIPHPNPKSGQCYKNTYEFAKLNPGWKIVHGICVGSGPDNAGKQMGHAWAEKTRKFKNGNFQFEITECYDVLTGLSTIREAFYLWGKITYTVVYSFNEATALCLKHKHYGAWDEKIPMAMHVPRRKLKRD